MCICEHHQFIGVALIRRRTVIPALVGSMRVGIVLILGVLGGCERMVGGAGDYRRGCGVAKGHRTAVFGEK